MAQTRSSVRTMRTGNEADLIDLTVAEEELSPVEEEAPAQHHGSESYFVLKKGLLGESIEGHASW